MLTYRTQKATPDDDGVRVVARKVDEPVHATIPDEDGLKDAEPKPCHICGVQVYSTVEYGLVICSYECVEIHADRRLEAEEAREQLKIDQRKEYKRAWIAATRNHQDHIKVCARCKSEFKSKRSDARFCSAKCRIQANRADKKIQKTQ